MEARRSTLGAAVLNNFIYAVGGFDGSSGVLVYFCLSCPNLCYILAGIWSIVIIKKKLNGMHVSSIAKEPSDFTYNFFYQWHCVAVS